MTTSEALHISPSDLTTLLIGQGFLKSSAAVDGAADWAVKPTGKLELRRGLVRELYRALYEEPLWDEWIQNKLIPADFTRELALHALCFSLTGTLFDGKALVTWGSRYYNAVPTLQTPSSSSGRSKAYLDDWCELLSTSKDSSRSFVRASIEIVEEDKGSNFDIDAIPGIGKHLLDLLLSEDELVRSAGIECVSALATSEAMRTKIANLLVELSVTGDISRRQTLLLASLKLANPLTDFTYMFGMMNPAPRVLDSLKGISVLSLASGGGHCLALVTGGKVYSWGLGNDGRLGHGSNDSENSPKLIESIKNTVVTHISCGSCHSMAVSEGGELFTWGAGVSGQLGHPDKRSMKVPTSVDWLSNQKIVYAAGGNRHSLALSDTHRVWAWGVGTSGQLGHGDGKDYTFPAEVDRMKLLNIGSLSCGGDFTAALSNDGLMLYTFGTNEDGQLGHGHTKNVLEPRIVKSLQGRMILKISCGDRHCIALMASGDIFSWGCNASGQLGLGDLQNEKEPLRMQTFPLGEKLRDIDCGTNHSAAVSIGGTLYVWGGSNMGQIAYNRDDEAALDDMVLLDKNGNLTSPAPLNAKRFFNNSTVSMASCGEATTLCRLGV